MQIIFALLCIAISYQAFGQMTSPPGVPKSQRLTKDQLFKPYNTIVTPATKSGMSFGAKKGSSVTSASYTRLNTQVNHPNAGQLFPDDAVLSQKLATFLSGLENNNYFLTYFAQLHVFLLHELYIYLTKIYTLFNVSHIDTISEYIQKESTQAMNKKTLIINHLINIIEAQLNSAILAYFPALPQQLATTAGPTMMQHDYGADLNLLLEKNEEEVFTEPATQSMVAGMRSTYLTLFGEYLSFFKSYTDTLNQTDQSGFGIPVFVKHAQRIQAIMNQATPTVTPNLSTAGLTSLLTSIKKINPPMFFYDTETMRGLKIIPTLAQALPENVVSIQWPQTIIKDAQSQAQMVNKFGNVMNTEPRAFFKDAQGQVTTSVSAAKSLFINIPTAQYIYQQEIIQQPSWLNSTSGVIKMLKACLGDYSALLDPIFSDQDILDPCLHCIVVNAASSVGIATGPSASECDQCQTFINSIKSIVKQSQGILAPPSTTPPTAPTVPSGV